MREEITSPPMGKKSSHKKQQQRQAPAAAKPAQKPAAQPMQLASLSHEGVVAPQHQSPAQKAMAFAEQNQVVRCDIQRIGLLLVLVAVLLAIAVVWNDKSQVLFNAGKHMASFMHLQ